jgi:hypothetical protein
MHFLRWCVCGLVVWTGSGTCLSQSELTATRRALLIGINTYQPAATAARHPNGCRGGRCDLPTYQNLNGPVNDVAAMRDLLSSAKFGFAPEHITVLTNPALPQSSLGFVGLAPQQTTHDGLLNVMRKYLVDEPKAGDTVVFYYAGHGSLRVNSKGTKLAMMVEGRPSHADSTLVPADAWTGVHDVRDREMTRIFNAALDKGVLLTVILDSCHSGSFTRGIELGPPLVERSLGYDPDDVKEGPDLLPSGEPVPAPAERKRNPALVFSAAQQDQTAKERIFAEKTATPLPHGAFTMALLEALASLPADAPASTVYQHVRAALEAEGIPDQDPSLDSGVERLRQPLFGGAKAESRELRAASIGVDDEGHVLLDEGQLSGIDVGSEFESITADAQGRRVKLRVESLEGLTHARAKVVTPVGAHVQVPEIFRLSKWVPRQVDALHFWTSPANLTYAQVEAVGKQVKAAGFTPVDDPVEQPWTDMLAWNGEAWELRHIGLAPRITLGAEVSATLLKSSLGPDARLWVNLPPPKELAAKLALHVPNSLVVGVADPAQADYVLAGTLTADGPEWAWWHKAEYLAGPPQAVTKNHSPGCSADSPYPVSSDWVLFENASEDAAASTGGRLNTYAGLLAKENGWLNLANDASSASPAAYYKLRFQRMTDRSSLADDQPVREGEQLKMILAAESPVSEPRWVYVLDIDCHGKGTLLYPYHSTGGRFPNDADSPHQLELPGAPTLKIGAPFGVDTILLISTQEPLPDPSALEFSGVATRGVSGTSSGGGATTPLQQLLSNTSAGTRGAIPEMPTNWSIDTTALRSIPK